MTITDPEGAEILRRCLDDPADLTGPLVLADWLQEQGDEARAEFVRVQCELERADWCPKVPAQMCRCQKCIRTSREIVLLRQHEAEWRRAGPCEACGGKGRIPGKPCLGCIHWSAHVPKCCACGGTRLASCPACLGTGDAGGLLRRLAYHHPDYGHAGPSEPVRVHFRRGLLDRVEVPRIEDCGEPRVGFDRKGLDCGVDWTGRTGFPCCCAWASESHGDFCPEHDKRGVVVPGWRPTPWLRAVVSGHPTVTQVVPLDRVPYWNGAAYCWYDADRDPPHNDVPESANLPVPLFVAVGDWLAGRSRWKGFTSPEAAVAALGRAVFAVARAGA